MAKEKTSKPLSEKQAKADRERINALAIPHVPAIAKRLLAKGHVKGRYWQAQAQRQGGTPMSLSVDLTTGSWQDFRNDAHGHDTQGLVAYVAGLNDVEAQAAVRSMIGVE
jgi:hypothetical protein